MHDDPLRQHVAVMPRIYHGRILAAFAELDRDHWAFTHHPGRLVAIRRWPQGAVDTIELVAAPGVTRARRDFLDGGRLLVSLDARGSVEDMITKVLALGDPAPAGWPA